MSAWRFCGIGLVLGLGVAAAQGPGRQQPRVVLLALDTDHDGTLSAAELIAAPVSLAKLDRNSDGQIMPDELSERPPGSAPDTSAMISQYMSFDKGAKGYLVVGDLPERMQGVFARADTDHDGKLTPGEITALSARLGTPNGAATAPGKATGQFRMDAVMFALDTNHDGVISAEEIAASSASLKTLDKNGDGQLTPDEMPVRQQTMEERAEHTIDENDSNKDGKLSRAETPERMAAQFDQIDLNHDGFLDKAELAEYMKTQGNAPRKPELQKLP